MEKLSLAIEGMSCGNCVRHVRQALEELDGVQVDSVEIGSAAVHYDPAAQTPQRIVEAVEEAGYTGRPVGSAA